MKTNKFRTTDGYTLYRIRVGGTYWAWVDNLDPDKVDLTFNDLEGHPADDTWEELEGEFIDE